MNRIVVLVFLFTIAFSSCNKGVDVVKESVPALNIKDVAYGSDAAQKMDVYLPAGRASTSTKVLVFIHGGSWSSGDKSDFNEGITAILPKLTNYAIVNINYRLANSGTNRFPTQITDIQSALDFVKSKGTEYMVDANKVGLIGASAGAHLALLQAYKFNTDGRVKAVVDLFGPTDLNDLYFNHPFPTVTQPVLVNFLGTTPTINAALYQQASPINFITPQSVPTQIFHGNLDIVNPISQSLALKAKLQASNVKVEMITYTGEGHGWIGSNLLDTYNKAVTFIVQNVQ